MGNFKRPLGLLSARVGQFFNFSHVRLYLRCEGWMLGEPYEMSHRIRKLHLDRTIDDRLDALLLEFSGSWFLVGEQTQLCNEANIGNRDVIADYKLATR